MNLKLKIDDVHIHPQTQGTFQRQSYRCIMYTDRLRVETVYPLITGIYTVNKRMPCVCICGSMCTMCLQCRLNIVLMIDFLYRPSSYSTQACCYS